MNRQTTEQQIVSQFCRLISARHEVAVEVPFLDRKIDIVFSNEIGQLVAVEVKQRDWGRGLRQAQYCLLGAEKVYLCLPRKELSENLRAKLKELGIGLIIFEESLHGPVLVEAIPPQTSDILWGPYQSILCKAFLDTRELQAKHGRQSKTSA